jgi:phenylpropionate dioxygenase-like ring-hydroxylating dioxygenase large terminal subunit
MIPICLHKEIKQNKVFCTPDGNLLLTRDSQNNLRSLSRTCPHMGFDLAYGNQNTLPLVSEKLKTKIEDKLCQHCPYHGWNLEYNYAEQDNILVYQGVVFYDDGVDPDWVRWISELSPQHWRRFKINCHWKHLLSNLVDTKHFHIVHGFTGGAGLSDPQIEYQTNNYVRSVWKSNFKRTVTSEVFAFPEEKTVVVRAPFGDTCLTSISLVIDNKDGTSCLLSNFFFDSDFYNTSLWMRFLVNRVVDFLVFEDKKILEKIKTDTPLLQGENNLVIRNIYENFNI